LLRLTQPYIGIKNPYSMAKTLVRTYCVNTANGDFEQHNLYYNTGILPADYTASPLTNETVLAATCSAYSIADGTVLETYCALDNSGKGVRRTVTSSAASLSAYVLNDTPDVACNGACDLLVTYQGSSPTTTTKTDDGTITIEASTSYPPVTVYIAGLGSNGFPTTTTVFNKGSFPETAQYVYKNVPAGSYSAILQDAGNCSRATGTLVVEKGNAPGTGGVGNASNARWFKYELFYDFSNVNIFTQAPKLRGYAWDPSTKQAYYTTPYVPVFGNYSNHLDYQKGEIVQLYERQLFFTGFKGYYMAKSDMTLAAFPGGVPAPSNTDYWTRLDPPYGGNFGTTRFFASSTVRTESFKQAPTPPDANTSYFYNEGEVMRYDWTGFYRTKKYMNSRSFPNGKFPEPTVGASNEYWEKVEGYDFFYFAADELDIIDQYMIGTLNRRVRFHAWNPEQLYFTPSTSNYFSNKDNDFVMFDDSTPTVETGLGDLKVIDIIKNDVDYQGAENGSVWVQAETPSPPVRYHLRNGVRPGYVQDNLTGIYENLHPGAYVVDIYDAKDRYVSAEFTIEDHYGLRWQLKFDDPRNTPLELRIFERDWQGGVTATIGTEAPVMHYWDDGDPTGKSLTDIAGSGLDFNVYTTVAQEFVDTATRDDRSHRVDYYRNGNLEFRGYLNPGLYREKMLGPGQPVTLTATCGLAQLSDTKWVNHLRERQEARTNMLSVVLKCLSFCDLNLPVWCGLNLRDKLMAASADPLAEAYIHRNVFHKKDGKVIADEDIIDCRTVLAGVLRGFNAHLTQAAGCWKIISLSEVYDEYAVRVWSPAGVLQTGVDTTPTPVRILPPTDATGANELYWIGANQDRTTVPPAIYAKATVGLQLEKTLLRNGDFVDWDAANKRPLYWTVEGATTTITRAKGEKAKEYAVQFAGYGLFLVPSGGLLSPPAPHLTGQDEDSLVLKFKAKLDHTTTNPADLTATLYFQVVCDGQDYGKPLAAEVSTKDNWKEQTLYLPTGLPGTSVRIRVLPPVATDAASTKTTLRLNSVGLAIQPNLVDWTDTTTDFFVATNLVVQTGVVLDEVELVVADLPLLPDANGVARPPKKMDVYAWRHAISLRDYSATTRWSRPGYPTGAPYLDNTAQDRMALYQVAATVLTGEVKGPGINVIRAGQLLDAPADVEGRFIVLNCSVNERLGTARITARKLADGYFGVVMPNVPNHARVANKHSKKGYRISFTNATKGYRVAHK